jgi:ABC-2 type transport system ATP-binding protein
MTSAIRVQGLQKEIRSGFWGRKVTLLRDVSFDVTAGCVFGFVGPNGAGKSTTIKVLLGAARPSAGEVELLGGSPEDRAVRARVGYLPELPSLPKTLSGRELLRLHARLAGVERIEARVDELFERVDLKDRGEQRIGTFSKGMQQRLLLASALLREPELLILDEPMSGLDPLGRRLVREIILDQRARGATVFFSSHILSDVEALSDEVALLVRGAVRRTGTLQDVVSGRADAWEVTFVPPEGEASAELSAVLEGLEVATHGAARQVTLPHDADALALAQRLQALGCRLMSVEERRPSLEDELAEVTDEGAAS